MQIQDSTRILGGALVFSLALSAQTFTTLYSFGSQDHDGTHPFTGVIAGTQGELYGTTTLGGAKNYGTVFELLPPAAGGGAWTETVLHSFSGGDGEQPTAGLLLGQQGALFGDTLWTAGGSGTTFELYPPTVGSTHWTENVLSQFTGANGGNPSGALSLGLHQYLYGTTIYGNGSIYSLVPPSTTGGAWTQLTIYKFKGGSDGAQPLGTLAVGQNGTLYGVTEFGGTINAACATGCGTVFALTPTQSAEDWNETVLHAFNPLSGDGISPYAGVTRGANGAIYGTTAQGEGGAGTVFSLTPSTVPGGPMVEAVIHVFGSQGDGIEPASTLLVGPHGVLYGTTLFGGAKGLGTVFQLTPPAAPGGSWSETILHSFSTTDGINPNGLSMGPGALLYGTTRGGGTSQSGTVFALKP